MLNPNIQYTYCKQEKAYIYAGKTCIFRGGEGIYIDGKNPHIQMKGMHILKWGNDIYSNRERTHKMHIYRCVKCTYIGRETPHI